MAKIVRVPDESAKDGRKSPFFRRVIERFRPEKSTKSAYIEGVGHARVIPFFDKNGSNVPKSVETGWISECAAKKTPFSVHCFSDDPLHLSVIRDMLGDPEKAKWCKSVRILSAPRTSRQMIDGIKKLLPKGTEFVLYGKPAEGEFSFETAGRGITVGDNALFEVGGEGTARFKLALVFEKIESPALCCLLASGLLEAAACAKELADWEKTTTG